MLWVIFTFAGLLGLNRSFSAELADRAIDGLLIAPIRREAVFLGKAFANLVFVLGVQLVAIPAVVLFYNLSLGWGGVGGARRHYGARGRRAGRGGHAVQRHGREYAVRRAAAADAGVAVLRAGRDRGGAGDGAGVNGRPRRDAVDWMRVLVAFDLVFVAACTVAYPLHHRALR